MRWLILGGSLVEKVALKGRNTTFGQIDVTPIVPRVPTQSMVGESTSEVHLLTPYAKHL